MLPFSLLIANGSFGPGRHGPYVMNNSRSQSGWQYAKLKESATRRVVERQV